MVKCRAHELVHHPVVAAGCRFGYTYGFQPASSLVTVISLPNAANINNSYDTLARLRQTALVNYWGHTQDAASYIPDPLGLRTNLVIKGSVLDIDILGEVW